PTASIKHCVGLSDDCLAFGSRCNSVEIQAKGLHEVLANWFHEFGRCLGSFHQDLRLPRRVEDDHRTAFGIISELKSEFPEVFSKLLPRRFLIKTWGPV